MLTVNFYYLSEIPSKEMTLCEEILLHVGIPFVEMRSPEFVQHYTQGKVHPRKGFVMVDSIKKTVIGTDLFHLTNYIQERGLKP